MEIAAAEFKARCLKLMDQVEKTREPVIVTKRGRPVAKLVPVENVPAEKLFGCMAGTVTILGDIVSPLGEAWSAQSGDEDFLYEPSK